MTSPNGATPSKSFGPTTVSGMQTYDRSTMAAASNADMQEMAEYVRENFLGGVLKMVAEAITGGLLSALGPAEDFMAGQYAIINDHSAQIYALQAEIANQQTLFGVARVFVASGTYYASPGTYKAELIEIGAGAGGGSGKWDLAPTGRRGGAGGGGGGELHVTIPGNLLFESDGVTPRAIPVVIGAGGMGATATDSPGQGGGNTGFLDLIAGGGVGGPTGFSSASGNIPDSVFIVQGGTGMIPGGRGGLGGTDSFYPGYFNQFGGSSASPYDLHGGGGGGGGGGGQFAPNSGASGGAGGVSPGGPAGSGAAGSSPSSLVPTGGGGGAGSAVTSAAKGGAGGFPGGAGGGGGGGSGSGNWGQGGNGAPGIVYVIEHGAEA